MGLGCSSTEALPTTAGTTEDVREERGQLRCGDPSNCSPGFSDVEPVVGVAEAAAAGTEAKWPCPEAGGALVGIASCEG